MKRITLLVLSAASFLCSSTFAITFAAYKSGGDFYSSPLQNITQPNKWILDIFLPLSDVTFPKKEINLMILDLQRKRTQPPMRRLDSFLYLLKQPQLRKINFYNKVGSSLSNFRGRFFIKSKKVLY